jgi:hypothetical protein
MAGEPIVARTAWSKGGTTYVTIRWNGAVRTRVARPDGRGGWLVTLPGFGDTAVILPTTVGTEPTEGRLAGRSTMGARLAAAEDGPRPVRRNSTWQDLPPASAAPQAPRDRTVFSQALKTIRARPDGATLDEIKESFREIDLYHHDPLTLLRWQHDNRGWGFKMNPSTGRVTLWTWGDAPQAQGKVAEPHIVTFSPPPVSAPIAQRNETQAHLEAEIERRRSEAQAEWQRIEEERRRLERERQELEEQRRLLAAASKPVPAPPPPPPDEDLPGWLRDLPVPDRYVFQHLADHGSINETEATQMLGGARQFRRFSVQLEAHLVRVPFKVRVEMSGDIKCYVRERGTE